MKQPHKTVCGPNGSRRRTTTAAGELATALDPVEVAAAAVIIGEVSESAKMTWVRTAEDAVLLQGSGFWDQNN